MHSVEHIVPALTVYCPQSYCAASWGHAVEAMSDAHGHITENVHRTQALLRSGRNDEALALGRGNLSKARLEAGPEHELTISAMVVLSSAYSATKDHASALPLDVEILAVRRRLHGDDDPLTHAALSALAFTHIDLDDNDAALPLLLEAVEEARRVMGSDHARTMKCTHILADVHVRMNKPELALPLYREAVASGRRVLGDSHVDTLHFIGSLGRLLCGIGSLDEGKRLLSEAVVGFNGLPREVLFSEGRSAARIFQRALDVANGARGDDEAGRKRQRQAQMGSARKELLALSAAVCVLVAWVLDDMGYISVW